MRKSSIAVPMAPPSTGSVPAPSSSIRTRLVSPASSIIALIFFIWPENVERDCSIDPSSPMSAKTASNRKDLISYAGTGKPDWASSTKRPMVLSETVFPPVFGPVMTTPVIDLSISKSIGTAAPLIRGCLAPFIMISR